MVNRIARLLLESGAIEYGDFLLASGARISYYIYIKAATTNPAILAEIGRPSPSREFEVVAGVAVGGVRSPSRSRLQAAGPRSSGKRQRITESRAASSAR